MAIHIFGRNSMRLRVFLIVGVLVGVTGLGGFAFSFIPESRTITLHTGNGQEGTSYIRIEGRYFGNLSGEYEFLEDASSLPTGEFLGFDIWTQEDWGSISDSPGHPGNSFYEDNLNASHFSVDLPASEAYYLSVGQERWTYGQGYQSVDGVPVLVHYHITGFRLDFVRACGPLLVTGALIACIGVSIEFYMSVQKRREG